MGSLETNLLQSTASGGAELSSIPPPNSPGATLDLRISDLMKGIESPAILQDTEKRKSAHRDELWQHRATPTPSLQPLRVQVDEPVDSSNHVHNTPPAPPPNTPQERSTPAVPLRPPPPVHSLFASEPAFPLKRASSATMPTPTPTPVVQRRTASFLPGLPPSPYPAQVKESTRASNRLYSMPPALTPLQRRTTSLLPVRSPPSLPPLQLNTVVDSPSRVYSTPPQRRTASMLPPKLPSSLQPLKVNAPVASKSRAYSMAPPARIPASYQNRMTFSGPVAPLSPRRKTMDRRPSKVPSHFSSAVVRRSTAAKDIDVQSADSQDSGSKDIDSGNEQPSTPTNLVCSLPPTTSLENRNTISAPVPGLLPLRTEGARASYSSTLSMQRQLFRVSGASKWSRSSPTSEHPPQPPFPFLSMIPDLPHSPIRSRGASSLPSSAGNSDNEDSSPFPSFLSSISTSSSSPASHKTATHPGPIQIPQQAYTPYANPKSARKSRASARTTMSSFATTPGDVIDKFFDLKIAEAQRSMMLERAGSEDDSDSAVAGGSDRQDVPEGLELLRTVSSGPVSRKAKRRAQAQLNQTASPGQDR
ncbi:hypothetical protein K474DRAFT_1657802 [Panus rudis PR-1116 ss-1]|nr:hypothetical protein K474DRAFT_1657802 [Panus rudis PR-1116 ss-1]